jgi:hypothetical protein
MHFWVGAFAKVKRFRNSTTAWIWKIQDNFEVEKNLSQISTKEDGVLSMKWDV